MSRRVLIVSSEFPPGPGGIGTHAHQLSTWLVAHGWEVEVAALQQYAPEDEVAAFNERSDVPVIRLPEGAARGLSGLQRMAQVARVVRRSRPDVILASGEYIVYLCAPIARAFRTPLVAVEHGWIPERYLLPVKRWAFGCADAVVCVSEYSRKKLAEMGVAIARASVIHNGADDSLFRSVAGAEVSAVRTRYELGAAPVLLTVGTVSVRKGQDVVIRAMPRVLAAIPDALYVMAGLPREADAFLALARELGVERHVRVLGTVPGSDLVALMNACEVAIMTSRHVPEGFEGFGIAVIEAALCGKPSIVTSDCGLTEAVVDGQTGVVVPSEDVDAVADAVIALLSDRERRTRMGEAARERAHRAHTWGYVSGAYSDVLQAVIQ